MVPNFTSSEDGPVYFWRETETPYGFLSQWYTAPFKAPTSTDDTSPIYFNTTEQYMMYRKAILFCDEEIAHQILQTDVPAKQKSLGRKVKGFNTALWDDHKESIVEEGNWLKFSTEENSSLKNLLLDTKDRELVEVGRCLGNRSVPANFRGLC
jgi:hypothetical protein